MGKKEEKKCTNQSKKSLAGLRMRTKEKESVKPAPPKTFKRNESMRRRKEKKGYNHFHVILTRGGGETMVAQLPIALPSFKILESTKYKSNNHDDNNNNQNSLDKERWEYKVLMSRKKNVQANCRKTKYVQESSNGASSHPFSVLNIQG